MRISEREQRIADAWMKEILAGVYLPRPELEIWEWAELNLRIPASENPELAGQLWRSSLTPWVREIMRWVRLPGKHEFFWTKSSQVGLTMAVLIIIVWKIVHEPTNIGYYIDSREEAMKISRSRLQKWILDNGILKEIGDDEDDLNSLVYYFRGMTVYLHGSYTGGAYRNKSLGMAVLDELDAHPVLPGQGTTADLARGRVKMPRNSKLLGFSTPKMESGQTWKEYLSGTQEQMFVKCPHCNHMQPLEWKGMRFDHCRDLAEGWMMDRVLTDTYYECEMGCKIQQSEKTFLFDEWEFRATATPTKANKRSAKISDLYSPFVTWGELAEEWIEAQKDVKKLQHLIQERFGEAYREGGGELKETDVLRLRQKYKKGTCPVKPAVVVMTVDVQKSTMKFVKSVFTKRGDLYVIDWGETGTWEMLLDEFNTPITGPDGEDCPVTVGLVDEGDGNRHLEVRRFCLPLLPDVFPVKGRGKGQAKDLVYQSSPYYVDGQYMRTYHVSDHAFKRELLFDRIKHDKKNENYDKPRLYLPRARDVDPGFVSELLNEHLEFKKNKSGYEQWTWVKTGDNDYLDCLKYALALWMIVAPALEEDEEASEAEEEEREEVGVE